MTTLRCAAFALAAAIALPVHAETAASAQTSPAAQSGAAPASNMEILRDKIKADKKLVVAANLGLTEDEAKKFWPVYEAYQTELQGINKRLGEVIMSYAKDFNANTLDDAKAQKLIEDTIAVNEAEAKLQKEFAPKLSEVLPAKKVARYMQIENKIRAIGKYEIAASVPLVE